MPDSIHSSPIHSSNTAEENGRTVHQAQERSDTVEQFHVDDLIAVTPSWLLRSGIGMVFFVCLTFLIAAFFIKYPDKIDGRGYLSSKTPPVELVSQARGRVSKIHKPDGAQVEKGDLLISLEGFSNPEDVFSLKFWLQEYERVDQTRDVLTLEMPDNLRLGILQDDYARLKQQFNEFKEVLKNNLVFRQINGIDSEIFRQRELGHSQEKERRLAWQQLELKRSEHRRNNQLHQQGIISDLNLEQSRAELLQQQRNFERLSNGIIQNGIRQEQLDIEKIELQAGRANLVQNYKFGVDELCSRLLGGIETWEQTYQLRAPISGRLQYVNELVIDRLIQPEEKLGNVLPLKGEAPYFLAALTPNNIGKVEAGQKAILKLDAFPHKEYGILVGKVASIATLPERMEEELFYSATIDVGSIIKTSHDFEIPFEPELGGSVEIITENKSILERIFNQIISLL